MKHRTFNIVLLLIIVSASFLFIYNYNKKNSASNENAVEEFDITNSTYKSDRDKRVAYQNYLGQMIEEQFTNEEGIDKAIALISYDEMSNQYSIELSLQATDEISEEQIENYKKYVKNFSSESILIINGDVK